MNAAIVRAFGQPPAAGKRPDGRPGAVLTRMRINASRLCKPRSAPSVESAAHDASAVLTWVRLSPDTPTPKCAVAGLYPTVGR
ncbi:hypothetical protein [Streptomyces mirabilis]|uniref:hypothetical protein n=1 Tax=Streptomyces mirabilis TaxID=68239 RepID=UPI00340EFC9B